jgi:hypothetical protein
VDVLARGRPNSKNETTGQHSWAPSASTTTGVPDIICSALDGALAGSRLPEPSDIPERKDSHEQLGLAFGIPPRLAPKLIRERGVHSGMGFPKAIGQLSSRPTGLILQI